MNRHWRSYGRAALALLLVASLTIVFVHWHRDSRGQDCGLCNVQQMPSVQSPTGNLLVIPGTREWREVVSETSPLYSRPVLRHQGRAPPQFLTSL